MRRHGSIHINNSNTSNGNHHPSVKEAVHVFNAIAREREEVTKSTSPVMPHPTSSSSANNISSPLKASMGNNNGYNNGGSNRLHRDHQDTRSIGTSSSVDSNHHHHHPHSHNHHSSHIRNGSTTDSQTNSLTNERYVSILNHCFDDIERFILRLQHSAAALRELQLRQQNRRGKKGSSSGGIESGDGLLAVRARGPAEEEFIEILGKFKLAFNLLAKLKGCIHDPNAPELVHFLFTPLAIIIEAARSNHPLPVDPCVVGLPFLNPDALELLRNCCTSKEYDLWQSLGINWTQPVKQHVLASSRILPVTWQPVFTDGWSPSITEPELMGFAQEDECEHNGGGGGNVPLTVGGGPSRRHYDSEGEESGLRTNGNGHHHHHHHNPHHSHHRHGRHSSSPSPIESEESPLEEGLDSPGGGMIMNSSADLEQADWLQELQSRNCKVVRVLFPRTANNDKELSVSRFVHLPLFLSFSCLLSLFVSVVVMMMRIVCPSSSVSLRSSLHVSSFIV